MESWTGVVNKISWHEKYSAYLLLFILYMYNISHFVRKKKICLWLSSNTFYSIITAWWRKFKSLSRRKHCVSCAAAPFPFVLELKHLNFSAAKRSVLYRHNDVTTGIINIYIFTLTYVLVITPSWQSEIFVLWGYRFINHIYRRKVLRFDVAGEPEFRMSNSKRIHSLNCWKQIKIEP